MRNWQKKYPPYVGDKPYLYFAFAEEDRAKAWRIMRILLLRGCRVWYTYGPAGSAEELLRRQKIAKKATFTILLLTDASCSDPDTKSNVLVNQKNKLPIICLDTDGNNRLLKMGLREDVPRVPVYRFSRDNDLDDAIIHAEGFSQDVMGETINPPIPPVHRNLIIVFCTSAVLLILISLAIVKIRNGKYSQTIEDTAITDEVIFTDDTLALAVREAAGGGAVTEELTENLKTLQLESIPASWDELEKLPSLEKIEIPQQALTPDTQLPDGDYTIVLTGGGL